MRMRTLFVFANLIAGLVLTFGLLAQSTGAWFGTWKLNIPKSKYDPGPAPKSQTTKLEPWEGGFKNTTDAVTAKGETRHIEYTGSFDGKDNVVKGNPDADANAYTRIDDHTYQVVAKKGGKATVTSRIVISADGKTRTQTQAGKNPQGQTVNNTLVFDRQ
ncbi:MAG: hypothetical protein JWO19_504 [Bryobacterales bacterium]|nr:hypothetical protein [Bryobacterales bacterium]